MKRSTGVVLVVLGVATGAAGEWWLARGESRRTAERLQAAEVRAGAAEAKVAALDAERMALAEALASEREARERLAAETQSDAEHRAAKRSANAAEKQNTRSALIVAGAAATGSDAWPARAEDPDVMRRLGERAELRVNRHYAALFRDLGLSPERQLALIKLLVDKREVAADVAAATYRSGGDPRDDPAGYSDMIAATREDLEKQIHTLLGDADYEKYKSFDRGRGQAQVIGQLNQLFAGIQQPLNAQQTAQLQAMLQANKVNGRISAKMVKDAATFLSPGQLQMLRDLRAIQQSNSQQRNAPTPPLPVGPGQK